MQLARFGNKYLAEAEPWKLVKENPERVKSIMNVSLQIAAALAFVSEPLLPFTAKKLQKMEITGQLILKKRLEIVSHLREF